MNSISREKLLNVLGLLVGFAMGQGSLLIAGSILISQGNSAVYGEVGLAIGLLSLLQWFVDWGALYWSSQRVAQNTFNASSLAAMVVARLAILGSICAALLLLNEVSGVSLPQITNEATFYLCLLIWCFNISGVLDGLNRSGKAGIIGNLSWTFAAVALLARPATEIAAICFTVGSLCSVALQWAFSRAYLTRTPFPAEFRAVLSKELRSILAYGFHYNSIYASGQTYGRFTIWMVGSLLGSQTQGYYVFIKSIVACINQVIVSIRRVEYVSISRMDQHSLTGRKLTQLTLPGAIFGASAWLLSAILLHDASWLGLLQVPTNLITALEMASPFLFVCALWSIYNGLSNISLVIGKVAFLSASNWMLFAGAAAAGWLLVPHFGLSTLVAVESILHIIQSLALILLFRFSLLPRPPRSA